MSDWEKLKVVELKEELKSRGVPLTGLKLKQQLVDKLIELDAGDGGGANKDQSASEDTKRESDDEPVENENEVTIQNLPSIDVQGPGEKSEESAGKSAEQHDKAVDTQVIKSSIPDTENKGTQDETNHGNGAEESPSFDDLTGKLRVEKLPEGLPAALKKEESQAQDRSTPPPFQARTTTEGEAMARDDPFVPQVANVESHRDERNPANAVVQQDLESLGITSKMDHIEEATSTTEPAVSTRVPTPEILEDQRKRKRRSLSPAPIAEDISHKKAKLHDGLSVPGINDGDGETIKQIQEATDASQAIRGFGKIRASPEREKPAPMEDVPISIEASHEKDEPSMQPSPRTPMQGESPDVPRASPDREVPAAMHAATSSLYIRNFKRPLHIPTLRNHILTIAGSSQQDSVKTFYLDSIRTHAFVSFNSVSAASRVRNAMHGTRFPDEPMRESLWVDFVPDEKVESWIERESGGATGGFGVARGASKKYEVIYSDGDDGIVADLQEVSNTSAQSSRPGLQQSQSNRMVSQDPTATAAVTSGIHPSRTPLVQQSPSSLRPQSERPQPPSRPADAGRGFRALDELFSSTNAKPKIYYKLPTQSVIDQRLDIIQRLRVGHKQMGQSGDEGMKRYSFERNERSGHDEWVDKGPEFGFGRRGQERLTGFGSSYGRGRGRGDFRGGRRGGDSWRGG